MEVGVAHDLQTLRAVYAFHVVRSIIAADGEEHPDEVAFRRRQNLAGPLAAAGLLDGAGHPTPAFAGALDEARARLPRELDQAGRLALVETFTDASLADGFMDRSEGHLLAEAAAALGLSGTVWMQHLARTDRLGDVELPEPEGVEGHLQLVDDPEGPTVTPADRPTETPDDR
jgi:uncharacterized tellurite resistance protein B-like protein